jgi:hypothetical protein
MASRKNSSRFTRFRDLWVREKTRQTRQLNNKKKMTDKDYKFWTEFRGNTSTRITYDELKRIAQMHADYYKHTFFIPCSCNKKKIQRFIDDINKVYESRENA